MTLRNGLIGLAVVLVLAIAGWFFFGRGEPAAELVIETETASTADIRRSVSATGTVRALVQVQVGSQLSGQIAELMVDFNSPVEEGQVIARIDPQSFETRVREAEASLSNARAQLQLQQATLQRVDANLRVAQQEYDRIEQLHERGIASDQALQTAQAQLESSQSERAVALAQIANARSTVEQREATLEGARIDVERTVIRSPINGVVVDRQVDVGQTVAASMSAPTLFVIARDLSQIQIDAQVDESDIGQIMTGQAVSFTVDAFPGQTYEGQVEQIRLAATNTNNVVTYTVVVTANNPGERLLPGMTANLDIVTGEREGVLAVPNSALRFRPSGSLEAMAIAAEAPGGGEAGRGGPGGGGPGGGGPGGGGGMMARLAEDLDMTEQQQQDAQAAMRRVFTGIQAQAASGQPVDRASIPRQIEEALRDVLTADQMRRYRELAAARAEVRPGSVWVERADGMLEERRVQLGVSDGQTTEIVGGQLEAGEDVVTRAREAG